MDQKKYDPFIKRTNVRNIKLIFSILNKLFIVGQWVYPKAVTDFVRKKFFTPVTKPLTKKQEAWIQKAKPYFVESRGRQLSVWKIGEGPSVLFVHGWNGRGVQFQRFFQPTLDAGYSVVFFDAPAHGMSEGDMTNYLEITESLEHIFNHEVGRDIAGVIAHSLGGSATINHLSKHHSEIPVVLIAAAFSLLELLFVNFQLHGVPKKTYLKLLGEVENDFQIPLETRNPIDLIYTINNPMLLIHDRNDKTTPIEPALQVSQNLPNAELFETKGFGHSLLLRQKLVVKKAIHFIENGQGVPNMERDNILDIELSS